MTPTVRDLEIEKRLTSLETKLEEIMTNHLAHLDSKLNWGIALLITTLIGVIVNMLKLN